MLIAMVAVTLQTFLVLDVNISQNIRTKNWKTNYWHFFWKTLLRIQLKTKHFIFNDKLPKYLSSELRFFRRHNVFLAELWFQFSFVNTWEVRPLMPILLSMCYHLCYVKSDFKKVGSINRNSCKVLFINVTFYRTQVSLGSDLWVLM